VSEAFVCYMITSAAEFQNAVNLSATSAYREEKNWKERLYAHRTESVNPVTIRTLRATTNALLFINSSPIV